jgi:hypothetical protein
LLLGIESLVFFSKLLCKLIPVDAHGSKISIRRGVLGRGCCLVVLDLS